jgi:NitT/TauT family transport system ATP-binding protein
VSAHLEIQHVFKRYTQNGAAVEVLQDMDATIERGEFVCVLGPSGCGKSTLINIIAGLETPSSGQVLLNGQPITKPGTDRLVVFQDAGLFPWLTVLGNVEFGLKMAGLDTAVRRNRALALIKRVHLSNFAAAYPYQLSGGMRQRVSIARVLAMDPEILLMDEPFGALDAQTRALLQDELLSIWQQTKKTIIFVTHNVREATGLADRVFEMSARPGRFKKIYPVHALRPRVTSDQQLQALQRLILTSQHEEVAKVSAEEYGEALPVPSDLAPLPIDRSLGMHI